MIIQCQFCECYLPSAEVKLRGKWVCDKCMFNNEAIKKEVMDAVDEMIACEADEEEYYKGKLLKIKERLNLLWGE